jgi:hypothetical protein
VAAYLAAIAEHQRHEKLGFRFGDMARELFDMDERTARNRVTLHQMLSERPALSAAFLDGRVTACQALVIRRSLTDDNEALWVGRCGRMTVAELAAAVRAEVNGDGAEEVDDATEMWSLSFEATPVVRLAWEEGLAAARRVLGSEAPVYRCVEAILAEAAPADCPEEVLVSRRGVGRRTAERTEVAPRPGADALTHATEIRRPADAPLPATSRSIRRARETLEHVHVMLSDLDDLLDTSPSDDPHGIKERIRALQGLERPLRVFLGRLLRHLKETGALYRMGYLRLEEFAAERLRLSERATRDLCRQCDVFRDLPELEAAFASGRIGIGPALLIERLAPRDLVDDFIARAEQGPFRQFRREMRLVEKFDSLGRGRYMKPLPARRLFDDLVCELVALGWTREDLAAELETQDFAADAAWVRNGNGGRAPSDRVDPAEVSIGPLEMLADLFVLSSLDPDDPRANDVRQTFSIAAGDLDGERRSRPVRFRTPEPIARHWYGALRRIRSERGLLPTWACVMLLVKRAVDTWNTVDRKARPSQERIVARDGYLCQVPGCTSRRNLEVHHIRFRSRGGNDDPSNLITLCHAHHRHMLHKGYIRLSGRAPHDLRWEIGCAEDGRVVWRLKGERFV